MKAVCFVLGLLLTGVAFASKPMALIYTISPPGFHSLVTPTPFHKLTNPSIPFCQQPEVSPLNFGDYASGNSGGYGLTRGSISVTCTSGTPYQIDIGPGESTDIAHREMSDGKQHLYYQIYIDAGYQMAWGDNVRGVSVSGIGTGQAQTYPVYGLLPAGQNVASGNYTDALNVNVNVGSLGAPLALRG